MCLFQISTLHNTLGTRSETHGAGGKHRAVRADPAQPRMGIFCPRGAGELPASTFHLCILPRFPWNLLISSSRRGRGCASHQGSAGELWSHAAVPGGWNKNPQPWPLPARGTAAGQRRPGWPWVWGQANPAPDAHHKLAALIIYQHSFTRGFSLLCVLLSLPCLVPPVRLSVSMDAVCSRTEQHFHTELWTPEASMESPGDG